MSSSKFENKSVTLDILSWIYFNEMKFNGFFYNDNQDSTVKPICTLQIFFFFFLIYVCYLLLLGIIFWYIIAKTISQNLPISRKFE